MKTTADLKALLDGINAEVAEKRATEEAARAAEVKEKIGVVMQLLPLVTASPKAAAAVRDQMYSVPEVKAAVRDYLRSEFLGFSSPLLKHETAQIAAAIGEFGEVSAERFGEIRKKNEAVYEHRKASHEGKWQHGCSECALLFVHESKADGAIHRYITMTSWAGKLTKELYDRNRQKLLPQGKLGPIGKAMTENNTPTETPAETPTPATPPAESRKERRTKKFGGPSGDGQKEGRLTNKPPRGGAKNLTLEAQSGAESDE